VTTSRVVVKLENHQHTCTRWNIELTVLSLVALMSQSLKGLSLARLLQAERVRVSY
jgi:competence protein ComGF